jgi:4a-hydroxytetrahydrobiopterin dehydratase
MTELTAQKCEACHSGAPRVSDQEMVDLMREVPEWAVKNNDRISMLERAFKFDNFKEAQNFANKVGNLAEEEFHHPSILLEWGKVTVTWWTHAIKGLHKNDFICAAKTDKLFGE